MWLASDCDPTAFVCYETTNSERISDFMGSWGGFIVAALVIYMAVQLWLRFRPKGPEYRQVLESMSYVPPPASKRGRSGRQEYGE